MTGAAWIRRGLFRLANYGMLPVLVLLVAMFSVQTITEQHPEGATAGRTLAAEILRTTVRPRVVAVAQAHDGDGQFVNALAAGLEAAFPALAGQASLWGIPNAVVLMLVLYAAAWVLMHRTVYGRYLYAVGGNPEAARLSGVPVTRVLLVAYFLCGLLAGVGGIMMASRTKSGSATYGEIYELSAIAAVVAGGTSISGGEGSILGTLIGAFIIAVIETGMNLTHVPAERQPIVLGSVILGAVLLDRLKQWAWQRRSGLVDEG